MPNILNAQGTVSTTGGIIYQPTTGFRSVVHEIRFCNTSLSAFHVTLSIFRADLSTTVQIYHFELDAGDLLADSGSYELKEGDYLYADTDVADTVFTMHGVEIEYIVPV